MFYGAVQVVEQNSNVGCTLEEEGPLPHCDDASPSSYATAFLEALQPMEWVEASALHRMLFLARKVSVSFKLFPPSTIPTLWSARSSHMDHLGPVCRNTPEIALLKNRQEKTYQREDHILKFRTRGLFLLAMLPSFTPTGWPLLPALRLLCASLPRQIQ